LNLKIDINIGLRTVGDVHVTLFAAQKAGGGWNYFCRAPIIRSINHALMKRACVPENTAIDVRGAIIIWCDASWKDKSWPKLLSRKGEHFSSQCTYKVCSLTVAFVFFASNDL